MVWLRRFGCLQKRVIIILQSGSNKTIWTFQSKQSFQNWALKTGKGITHFG
jgi:hypothetical protein